MIPLADQVFRLVERLAGEGDDEAMMVYDELRGLYTYGGETRLHDLVESAACLVDAVHTGIDVSKHAAVMDEVLSWWEDFGPFKPGDDR